jgi:hypothetical protein
VVIVIGNAHNLPPQNHVYAGVFIVLMEIVNLQVFLRVTPQALLSRRGLADILWKLPYLQAQKIQT